MSQGRRIAESSTALLFSNVANKITGFLIMLTVARLLGADRFGLYTAIFAYVSVFGLLSDLGLTTVVIRGLSQDSDAGRRRLGNALLLRWPLAIASYVTCTAGALVLYGNSERTWLIAVSALSFLVSPLATHSAVFHANLLLRVPAAVSLASRVALLIAVQWLARNGGTLQALVIVEVLLGALNNITVWLWSRSIAKPVWKFEWPIARSILLEGLPLFLTSAFITLYFRIDVFFLDHFRTQAEIGAYAAAFRLTEAMPLIASAVTNSIFPVLCQQVHNANETSLNTLIRISLKILLGVVVAMAIILTFYSKTVIAVLYGGRFSDAAPLLAVLACSQILVYTNILTTTLLVARGQSRTFMYVTLAMLAWNLTLNTIVIPRYGALGAAWTTLGTELAGTIGCLILTSTGRVFLQTLGRLAIPATICAILLAFFAPIQVELTANAFLPAVAVLLVYVVAVAFLRVFDPEEREQLRKLAWQ